MKKYSALLGLLLFGCASQQEAASCAAPEWEWANYKAMIESENAGSKWTELNSGQRASLLSSLNALPPQTGYVYTRIGYFRRGDGKVVLMVMMLDNCVWEARMLPFSNLKILMGGEA